MLGGSDYAAKKRDPRREGIARQDKKWGCGTRSWRLIGAVGPSYTLEPALLCFTVYSAKRERVIQNFLSIIGAHDTTRISIPRNLN